MDEELDLASAHGLFFLVDQESKEGTKCRLTKDSGLNASKWGRPVFILDAFNVWDIKVVC